MKRIGKIAIGIALAAGLIGGGVWYAKQRAAQNPETRYKLATIEKGDVTQTVSANGSRKPVWQDGSSQFWQFSRPVPVHNPGCVRSSLGPSQLWVELITCSLNFRLPPTIRRNS